MNIWKLLWGAAEFAVIIPGILLCLLPVKKWLRVSSRKLFPIVLTLAVFLCLVGSFLEINNLANGDTMFVVILVLCLPLYLYMVNLNNFKLVYVYLCTVAILSFGGLLNHFTESFILINTPSTDSFSSFGLVAQWIFSLFVLVLYKIIYQKKLLWLLSNFEPQAIWGGASLLPLLITHCNRTMLPRNYSIMNIGRVMIISWTMLVTFFVLYLLFIGLFYFIALFATEKYNSETKAQLAQMQRSQYESMQNYFLQTSQLRHDFRHTVRTISELAEHGQYDDLKNYLNVYNEQDIVLHPQKIFCSHPAANALLQYYVTLAESSEIDVDLRIVLPSQLSISDVDLCVILGNLLENSIHACSNLPVLQRKIQLSVDLDPSDELYIVMCNSFDGTIRQQGGRFLSTKNSSGIGITSVSAIVDKYQGVARFYAEKHQFHSNIMLKVSKNVIPN